MPNDAGHEQRRLAAIMAADVVGYSRLIAADEAGTLARLKALTLAIYKVSLVIRLAYSGTREAMLQDYVRFARAKGLSRRRILGGRERERPGPALGFLERLEDAGHGREPTSVADTG